MKCSVHRCVECGSLATHSIADNIKTIFRMEQVHFSCGAVKTISSVDCWQASKVRHEGCPASERFSFHEGVSGAFKYY
jgi:hypothetical protein